MRRRYNKIAPTYAKVCIPRGNHFILGTSNTVTNLFSWCNVKNSKSTGNYAVVNVLLFGPLEGYYAPYLWKYSIVPLCKSGAIYNDENVDDI